MQEIVRAYRKKAMLLHPDRNPAPDATQQFILLEEAYKYLRSLKEIKDSKGGDEQLNEFAKWWENEKANVRKKAEEYSKMRYDEYQNSDDHKFYAAKNNIINVVVGLAAIFALIVVPLWWYATSDGENLYLLLIYILFVSPIGIVVFSQLKLFRESIKGFGKSIGISSAYLRKKMISLYRGEEIPARWLNALALTGLNGFLIFKVVVNTLVPIHISLLLFGLTILSGFLISRFYKKKPKGDNLYYTFCIAPVCLNVLFAINYVVSFNTEVETYRYKPKHEIVPSRISRPFYWRLRSKSPTSLIILEGEKYKEYKGLRVFLFYGEVIDNNTVTYTFKTGIFGIRVMKDYKLSYIIYENW